MKYRAESNYTWNKTNKVKEVITIESDKPIHFNGENGNKNCDEAYDGRPCPFFVDEDSSHNYIYCKKCGQLYDDSWESPCCLKWEVINE